MKITVEELDATIIRKLSGAIITQQQEACEYGKLGRNSKEFQNVIESLAIIFIKEDKTIKNLIFNSLLIGVDIGYKIAENNIEVNQLEVMCGMDKEEGK